MNVKARLYRYLHETYLEPMSQVASKLNANEYLTNQPSL